MMNRKFIKIFFVLTFLLTVLTQAQSAGNTGLSFLKLGFGARNIAMGDAGNALANDVSALFYNPAKLAGKYNSEIMFMHNEWIQDVRSEIFGVKTELFGLPMAIGANVTKVSNIEFRTKPGDAETIFDANYFFGSLSTGFNLFESLDFGITIKYIYEGLIADEANGIGYDLGLNYITDVEGLTFSAVLKNLGSMNTLRSRETALPKEYRIGAAYVIEFPNSNIVVTTAAEIQKYSDTDDSHLNLGGEVFYDNTVALRAGYQTGYEAKNFTAGVGLLWGKLKFDYAYQNFSFGLGSGNIFSVQFNFY